MYNMQVQEGCTRRNCPDEHKLLLTLHGVPQHGYYVDQVIIKIKLLYKTLALNNFARELLLMVIAVKLKME